MSQPLKSWVRYDDNCQFPIQNLPYGVFEQSDGSRHIGVAIGNEILDLYQASAQHFFPQSYSSCLQSQTLNEFMALSPEIWSATRKLIQELLCNEKYKNQIISTNCLVNQDDVRMVLPCKIGDYTDFYSSKQHATNVGTMFRGKENALKPNWLHLPVGYHGRASSVVVSGTPVRRPLGQLKSDINDRTVPPTFGKCQRLDIELEVGFFFGGQSNEIGQPIGIKDCQRHIFGMVLLNDWSARDIQKWEYIPLGPFNAKNFCSSISPWIVTMDALKPFRVPLPKQSPQLLPYLCDENDFILDLDLFVSIKTPQMKKSELLCKANTQYLYYSSHQQLAHHTITGCPMNAGDMLGSGTISGENSSEYGSFLELSWSGKKPITLSDGTKRSFLNDGDEIIIGGFKRCNKGNFTIGFGECRGVILPALNASSLSKL